MSAAMIDATRVSPDPTGPFDAIIVGAGFAGLYQLHQLREKLGLSVLVLEAGESAPLQRLGVERHAEPIVPEDLHQVAALAAEYIEIARVWITLRPLLNRERQAIHAAAHVGVSVGQPHPHASWRHDHRRTAAMIRRRLAKPTSVLIRTLVPSGNLISTLVPSALGRGVR